MTIEEIAMEALLKAYRLCATVDDVEYVISLAKDLRSLNQELGERVLNIMRGVE